MKILPRIRRRTPKIWIWTFKIMPDLWLSAVFYQIKKITPPYCIWYTDSWSQNHRINHEEIPEPIEASTKPMDRTPRLWFRFPVGEECHKQPWPDLVLTAEPIKTGSMLLCIVQHLYIIMYKQPQGVGRSSFWGTKAKVEYFVLFVANLLRLIFLTLILWNSDLPFCSEN